MSLLFELDRAQSRPKPMNEYKMLEEDLIESRSSQTPLQEFQIALKGMRALTEIAVSPDERLLTVHYKRLQRSPCPPPPPASAKPARAEASRNST